MSNFKEQLQNVTRDVHLSAAEKSALRERLVSYMEHRPIRRGAVGTPSPFMGVFSFSYVRFAVPALLVAVVFVSGGVSYAAEGAVPGDTLYPVKIRVNEEVRSALIFDEEEKLAWNIRRAERRLEEASTLAAEGGLNEETQSVLAAQFEAHAADVAADVEAVRESNPALALEIDSQFEASLMAHGEVIEQVTGDSDEARAEAGKLLARVEAKRIELSDTLAIADAEALNFSAEAGPASMSLRMKSTGPVEDAPEPSATASQEETFSIMALPEGDAGATAEVQMGTQEPQTPDDASVKHKEAAERMDKLVSAKIEIAADLFERYEESLTGEQQESVKDLIANLESHVETARERNEEGEYTEAFRKFRALLLTALRLEVYLRAVGELNLTTATLPTLPLGFPEFNRPHNSRQNDVEERSDAREDRNSSEESRNDNEPETSADEGAPEEVDRGSGAELDAEVRIDLPL